MKPTPRLLFWLGLPAIAILSTSAVYLQRSSALRMENQALASHIAEAERIVSQPEPNVDQLRSDNLEVQRLRDENRDLPSLRNEVHQLREAAKELPLLQAENQRLRAAITSASGQVSAIDVSIKWQTSFAIGENEVVSIRTTSGAAAVVQFTMSGPNTAGYRWRSYAAKSQPIKSGTGQVRELGVFKPNEIVPATDTTVRAGDILLEWSLAGGARWWLYYNTNLATIRILPADAFDKDF